ncbi:MAG TPA: hypothetical protein VFC19_22505, partial [Candidatus Limnocylindrales bacterium]|nr:hypothetical protein [Candidatus Limnocylindrales bacterium]
YDDDENGQGNALFLRNLILGRAPGPDFPDVEELRVPIFIVPGNHDYRLHPYHLIFNLDYLGHHRFRNYEPYHLQSGDALALWTGLYGGVEDGVPDLDKDSAARMVAIDPDLRPYRECLADRGSYVVRLGAHRIVMLDSAHDVGVLTSGLDGIRAYLHFASEDELTFAGGSPNCDGVSEAELKLATDALAETADGGLFILGIHAPLFNLWSNELPYFLRETQRPRQPGQDIGFLARHGGKPLPVPSAVDEFVREHWPLWFPGDQDHREPVFVKRGGTQDLLDYGVSRGHTEDLLRLLSGIGSRRPADVVLSGHTHFHNEFVVGRTGSGDELAYLMDFYTHNPTFYYPTRYATSFKGQSDGHTIVTSEVTYVEVDPEATGDATPWPMPYAAQHAKQLQVPPSPAPLSQSQDPRAWWAAHRPLILQTGALGPMENNQVSFSGFRLLSVKGDMIDKVHSISINRLEANGYRLALEDAVRPDPPRRYRHIERGRRDHAPQARGAPAAINLPTLGGTSVVYRDAQGHLDELWKGNGGDRATGDATANAGAPAAAGDPSVFFEAPIGNLLTIYRSADGHVHDLYWSTGAVGHDNITGSIGAPRAAGEPRGALLADGINHVIYRTGDGHLHALWWTGGDPAGHEDMTAGLSAPPAAGDPSPWVDTTRGRNHLAYRATDGHVRGFYWNGGSDGHEDLSGFAGSPNAAGDPVAYYLPGHDMHQIFYRGVDRHLYEVYCVGEAPVAAWDLTVSASAPPADSDPAVYYSAANDTKHVIYRSADGHLHEIWWVFGTPPAHVDLTVEALAPPAVDRPAAFTIDGPNSQHVIYRGADNQIHEITWQTSLLAGPNTQGDWRWCNKCQGMFWGGNVTTSHCPAGGTHSPPDQSGSRDYILPFSMALV